MKTIVGVLLAIVVGSVALSTSPGNASAPPPAASTGWTLEPVGFHGGSAPPDIGLDSHGVPQILFCPPGESRYAVRGANGWTNELFSTYGGGGVCGNLAVGPGDVPHVTTPFTAAIGCPAYGVRRNITWDLSCFPGGVMDAVDSLGRPHAVTYWTITATRYDLRHLWREANGTWQFETAEANALGAFPSLRWYSMVLDAADNPRVLYYDSVRGDVRYAFRDASGWHVEVVEHAGFIGRVGRGGQLALRSGSLPVAIYGTGLGPKDLRYAVRGPTGWTSEVVDDSATFLVHPTLSLAADVPCVAYEWIQEIDASLVRWDQDLLFRCRGPAGWSREVVLDGIVDGATTDALFAQFPDLKMDRCGNPQLAFYKSWTKGIADLGSGVYYATKGDCPTTTANVTLRVEPRTLNLKSKGQWVNAQITVNGATAADVDLASLRLNGVPAARTWTWGSTITAKFDRGRLEGTLAPGNAVSVTLTGTWRDGGTFTATDTIRVIRPGR